MSTELLKKSLNWSKFPHFIGLFFEERVDTWIGIASEMTGYSANARCCLSAIRGLDKLTPSSQRDKFSHRTFLHDLTSNKKISHYRHHLIGLLSEKILHDTKVQVRPKFSVKVHMQPFGILHICDVYYI
jgi:hypothetical protein